MTEKLFTPRLSKQVGLGPRTVMWPKSMEEVNSAGAYRLLEWYRFLSSPETGHQRDMLDRITFRLWG
jgi:hypothetical protein